MNATDKIPSLLQSIPDKPGIYQYYDEGGTLIYIGKAKNLKKRVGSYFNRDHHDSGKTAILVKKIRDIKFIVVSTELDALLLENNLIKKHQPRYNILMRDDKTYPWICIKNERFPRIFSTRKLIRDGSQYFGPYASVKVMNMLLELSREWCKPRTCNFSLSEENIKKKKFKICLEYHIGNCKGPCEGLQREEDYNQSMAEVKEIIKGHTGKVIRMLQEEMKGFSDNLQFEKAHAIMEKIEILEKFQSKSLIVSPTIHNVDIFSIVTDELYGYVNYLKIINGAIIQAHTLEMKKKLDEPVEELLTLAMTELRLRFDSDAKEIIVPFKPEIEIPGVEFHVPQIGDKKKLLDLSERNANYSRIEREKQEIITDPERHTKRILAQMMNDLRLKEEPRHIECFDNSNIQGAHAVSAMVVFRDARPSKKEYRHYTIKTVEGPNDFASMEEVIYRRYKKLLDENAPLPQLIVIDGGKGQLSSALNSLEKLGLRGKIGIISIAKKLEEIYYPGDSLPMYLDKKSETLRIIQHLRNEAHRFGIGHHRKKRSKATIKTELTEIPGVSDITAEKLLRKFKSVKLIKETTEEKLSEIIGPAKAKLLRSYFEKQSGT